MKELQYSHHYIFCNTGKYQNIQTTDLQYTGTGDFTTEGIFKHYLDVHSVYILYIIAYQQATIPQYWTLTFDLNLRNLPELNSNSYLNTSSILASSLIVN